MVTYSYLNDESFLKYFDRLRVKEQYVRIIALDFRTERELESIEGKVVSGNLTLQNSAIRRTGNLTMIADERTSYLTDINSIISLNKKIRIEIGFKNDTQYYKQYETIWFPLGYYVITSASVSHSLQDLSISVTFSDKMCLLNGDIGGKLSASVDFLNVKYRDKDGKLKKEAVTMYQTIRELVNHYGGEQISKIIISDLLTKADKKVDWANTKKDVYFYKDSKDGEWHAELIDKGAAAPSYDEMDGPFTYGDMIGLERTDFTYPGKEFVGNPGESVCSVLDRINQALGQNYEYFYDIDGNFIFQEIKNYLNTTQTTLVLNQLQNKDYLLDRGQSKSVYSFVDNELISSINDSPQYNLIRNDFIVWGAKKNINDNQTPVRYHLAINKRPTTGNIYKILIDKEDKVLSCPIYVNTLNDLSNIEGLFDFYYYVKENQTIYQWIKDKDSAKFVEAEDVSYISVKTQDYRTELYFQGLTVAPVGGSYLTVNNDFYIELKDNWDSMFHLEKVEGEDYYTDVWNQDVLDNPYLLNYFLDIIDSDAEVSKFNIDNIGKRSEVINNNDCNCVFESPSEQPEYYFVDADDEESIKYIRDVLGCRYIVFDDNFKKEDLIQRVDQNSAFNAARNLLYQFTSYNNRVSFTGLPIYHLDINTRVTIRDTQTDLFGDFIIDSISLPLSVEEEMSLNATQALQKI